MTSTGEPISSWPTTATSTASALHLDGRPFQIGDRVVVPAQRPADSVSATAPSATSPTSTTSTAPSPSTPPTGPGGCRASTSTTGTFVTATPSRSTKPRASRVTTRCCSAATSSTESPATSDSPRGRESNRIYAVSTAPDPEAHIPKHLRTEREPLDVLTHALEQTRAQKLGIDHDAEPDVGAGL